MRSRTLLLALFFIAGAFAVPVAAHAAIPFLGPIIPETYNVCPAGWGMLMDVINNIISFFITIAIIFVAPLSIAYAGFLMVVNPTNSGGITKAKEILLNTVIGIVISLAAWLIVDAIMAVLYNPSSFGSTWSQLVTSGGIAPCLPQAGAQPTDTLNQTSPTGITAVPAAGNEQAIRARFAAAGVSINNAPCTGSSGSGCTNVAGMQEAAVQEIIALANACGNGCVVITGGTEPGHAPGTYSHANGYKVDLRTTDALNNFIKGKMRQVGTRTGNEPGPIYWDSCGNPAQKSGNQYVFASDHWDNTIYAYCPI